MEKFFNDTLNKKIEKITKKLRKKGFCTLKGITESNLYVEDFDHLKELFDDLGMWILIIPWKKGIKFIKWELAEKENLTPVDDELGDNWRMPYHDPRHNWGYWRRSYLDNEEYNNYRDMDDYKAVQDAIWLSVRNGDCDYHYKYEADYRDWFLDLLNDYNDEHGLPYVD